MASSSPPSAKQPTATCTGEHGVGMLKQPYTGSQLGDTLHRLVRQAWLDLKQARLDFDLDAMRRTERRMNALLDQVARRTLLADV
jgi:hypothetical protein